MDAYFYIIMAILSSSSGYLADLDYNNLTTAEKSLVDALISFVNDYLEEHLNRVVEAADFTEIIDGTGEHRIFVKNPPINNLTKVEIHDISSADDEITTIYANGLLYKSDTGEIQAKAGTCFPQGFRNIYIYYNGGFTTVPPALEMLAADFVLREYNPQLAQEGMQKEREGDYFYDRGVNYFEKLPLTKKKILSYYRIRHITTYYGE